MRLARRERQAICDTFLEVGPDAPTLAGEWTSADLAAHLYLREGPRLDLAAGIAIPALASRTDTATQAMARKVPLAELVERVRKGPPVWHPTRVPAVDERVNLVEMFVHHEDLRRARPGAEPRRLDAPMTEALESRLRLMGPLLLRKASDLCVELVTPRGRRRIGSGERPVVEIHGDPAEILLFLFGRKQVAQVELVGDQESVAALCAAPLGL